MDATIPVLKDETVGAYISDILNCVQHAILTTTYERIHKHYESLSFTYPTHRYMLTSVNGTVFVFRDAEHGITHTVDLKDISECTDKAIVGGVLVSIGNLVNG